MGPKRNPNTVSIGSRTARSFADDDRAIEGLPIRLVIALIIGVVSLGIMLQILGSIDTFETNTEVDVEFEDSAIDEGDNGVSVYVIDEDGQDVTEGHVVAQANSVRMDGALDQSIGDCSTCDENEVEFNFGSNADMELPPDQSVGEIDFTIQTPTDSNWEDDEPNNQLLVTE